MLKLKSISLLFCILLFSLSEVGSCKFVHISNVNAQVTGSYRFTGLAQDGFIDGDAWDGVNGTVCNASEFLWVGFHVDYWFNEYRCRSYVYFNTSTLNNEGVISASLWLWKESGSGPIFGIRILNGQPTFPHDPLESNDFDRTKYSGNGGESLCPSDSSYFSIRLTTDGVSWINRTGITKFSLWADWDADEDYDFIGSKYVWLADSENTTYPPYLIVNMGRRSTSNIVFAMFGWVGGLIIGVIIGLIYFKRNMGIWR